MVEGKAGSRVVHQLIVNAHSEPVARRHVLAVCQAAIR